MKGAAWWIAWNATFVVGRRGFLHFFCTPIVHESTLLGHLYRPKVCPVDVNFSKSVALILRTQNKQKTSLLQEWTDRIWALKFHIACQSFLFARTHIDNLVFSVKTILYDLLLCTEGPIDLTSDYTACEKKQRTPNFMSLWFTQCCGFQMRPTNLRSDKKCSKSVRSSFFVQAVKVGTMSMSYFYPNLPKHSSLQSSTITQQQTTPQQWWYSRNRGAHLGARDFLKWRDVG